MAKQNGHRKKTHTETQSKFSRVFGIPETISSKALYVEIQNNHELFICGYRCLVDYNERSIILCLHDETLFTVCGVGLTLCLVAENTMEITGRITSVRFGEETEGENT